MGRLHITPSKNPLGKRRGDGVLSGAEKRRRMLEAGKRFVMKSVQSLSPARLAKKNNKRTLTISRTSIQDINDCATPKLIKTQLNSNEFKTSPVRRTKQRFTSKQKSTMASSEEPLRDINNVLGQCVSKTSTSSAVSTRQNRKSFFPSGVNPIDETTFVKQEAPPEKPPRCFRERDLNVLTKNVGVHEPMERRHGKSVRFAERVLQNRRQNIEWQVKEWTELVQSINDDQMMRVMQSIPKESFSRLIRVAARVGVEASGKKRPLMMSNISSYEVAQEDVFENEEIANRTFIRRSPYHLRSNETINN